MSSKMIDKVRALLRKAEDPAATTAEREAFNAKAAELMTKHVIDRSQLSDLYEDKARRTVGQVVIPVQVGVYQKTTEGALYQLAKAFGFEALIKGVDRSPQYGARGADRVEVWGIEEDLALFEVLWTSIQVQMARGLDAARSEMLAACPKPGHQIAWKNNWMAGFGAEVAKRVRQQRAATVEATSGAALVLAEDADLVRNAFKERYPRLGSASSSNRQFHAGAWGSGSTAGKRADIGNKRVGATAALTS